jgi:hypothetical protein
LGGAPAPGEAKSDADGLNCIGRGGRALAFVEAHVPRDDGLVLDRDLQPAVPSLLAIPQLLEPREIVLVAVVVKELVGALEGEPRHDRRPERDAAHPLALAERTLARRRALRPSAEHLERRAAARASSARARA